VVDPIHSVTVIDEAVYGRSAEPFAGSASRIVQKEEMRSDAGEEERQGSLLERKRSRESGIMKSASLVKVGYTVPSQKHQQEAGRCSVSQDGKVVNGARLW
jgi:hypothetical protein